MEIEGVADEKVFGHTKKALTIAGIGADLQSEMWKLVSAILHLGNWKKGITLTMCACVRTLCQHVCVLCCVVCRK
jgi:hypothetical protein